MSATPRKRQRAVKIRPVAMGQNLTHAVQQNRPLFDNVVGAAEQREPNPSALAVVAGCTCRSLGFSLLRFSRHKCRAADTPRQDWFRNSETARHDA